MSDEVYASAFCWASSRALALSKADNRVSISSSRRRWHMIRDDSPLIKESRTSSSWYTAAVTAFSLQSLLSHLSSCRYLARGSPRCWCIASSKPVTGKNHIWSFDMQFVQRFHHRIVIQTVFYHFIHMRQHQVLNCSVFVRCRFITTLNDEIVK